ncbi:MAG: cyclic nucleotide-binding domain-containing protein [Alphaproteobacteria bacterium]|nr:cyclic nucleotide-binding domain-containing protein [Alphaproteobacteria bacterium]
MQDGADTVREGDEPSRSCLLVSGFVARYKLVDNGRRQILAFHTPGDIPNAQTLHLKRMDHPMAHWQIRLLVFFNTAICIDLSKAFRALDPCYGPIR